MIYNYHTHTHRCKHASGTEEEYVKRALEGGIKFMGFADHIPLRFEDGTESCYRVPLDDGRAYCKEIKVLANKYRDKLDIKVGFESEYYPEYFEQMFRTAINCGAEYLILGQHYIKPENTSVNHVIDKTDCVRELKEYVSVIIAAMKTGVFTYVAHPDMFNFTGDAFIYRDEMRKLCKASRELNIPLEVNLLGIRDGRCYPNEEFWKIAGEEKSPVTFGFDSHDAQSAYDGESIIKAKELVLKYNLNYIGKPNYVLIQEL